MAVWHSHLADYTTTTSTTYLNSVRERRSKQLHFNWQIIERKKKSIFLDFDRKFSLSHFTFSKGEKKVTFLLILTIVLSLQEIRKILNDLETRRYIPFT